MKEIIDAQEAFKTWKEVPAPKRGEVIRILGNKLREKKEELAQIITSEVGKIYQESLGEVQEMIDICDFAVGLSRQLYGLTIVSRCGLGLECRYCGCMWKHSYLETLSISRKNGGTHS